MPINSMRKFATLRFCLATLAALGALVTVVSHSLRATPFNLPPKVWGPIDSIWEPADDLDVFMHSADAVEDATGNLHVVWHYQHRMGNTLSHGVMYSYRNPDGDWEQPEIIGQGWSEYATIATDAFGYIHVAWAHLGGSYDISYRMRDVDGNWSAEETLQNNEFGEIRLEMASDGTLYLFGEDVKGPGRSYYRRLPGGEWEPLEFPWSNPGRHSVVLDQNGKLHLIYYSSGLRYAWKSIDDVWSAPITIVEHGQSERLSTFFPLSVDSNGLVHLAWTMKIDYSCPPLTCQSYEVQYSRVIDGRISDVEVVAQMEFAPTGPLEHYALVGSNELTHLAWTEQLSQTVNYASRSALGTWHLDENTRHNAVDFELLEGPEDELHFFWWSDGCYNVFHQWKWRSEESEWSTVERAIPRGRCGNNELVADMFSGASSAQVAFLSVLDTVDSTKYTMNHREFIDVTPVPTSTSTATPTVTATATSLPSPTPVPATATISPTPTANPVSDRPAYIPIITR